MIKTLFSFLIIFSFLCISAQEKDSLKSDELPDIIRTTGDCKKSYEKNKINDEKAIGNLKNIDFETFFDKIFELKEFKMIKKNKSKILYLYIDDGIPIASDVVNADCKEYHPNLYFSIFEMLWNKNNYMKFQKFFKNKIIIPSISSYGIRLKEINGKLTSYSYLIDNDIKPIYEGVYIDTENKTKNFYYTSNKKINKKLEIHLYKNKSLQDNSITIYDLQASPSFYKNLSNVYSFKFRIYNGKDRIEKEFWYQYQDRKWILLDENK